MSGWSGEALDVHDGGQIYRARFYQSEEGLRALGNALTGAGDLQLRVLYDQDGQVISFPRGSTVETVWDCINRGADILAAQNSQGIGIIKGKVVQQITVGISPTGESYL